MGSIVNTRLLFTLSLVQTELDNGGVLSTCGLSSTVCMRWAHLAYQLWLLCHQCTALADHKTAKLTLERLQVYCPDTVLPQCRRKLRIVWIKPAQKGLKLCYIRKASHAQDPAQSKYRGATVPIYVLLQHLLLAHLACTNRTAMMKSTISVLGTKPHHWGCNV